MRSRLPSKSRGKLRLDRELFAIETMGANLISKKNSFFPKDSALEMSFLIERMFIRVSRKFTAGLSAVDHASLR